MAPIDNPTQRSVVVFGGSGFIGSHLIHFLNDAGFQVYNVDIVEPKQNLGIFVYADIRKVIPNFLEEIPEIVFNLAAIHRTPGHAPREYYETNVLGALNITEWCSNKGIERIVFLSSISVYGTGDKVREEITKLEPISDYGKSKLMAEKIHENWAQNNETRRVTIVRPAAIFGQGERGNFTRITKALSRGLFVNPSNKNVIKACGYVKDLVSCIWFAQDKGNRVEIFNFSFPTNYTVSNITEVIVEIGGRGNVVGAPFGFLVPALEKFPEPLPSLAKYVQKLNSPTLISTQKLLEYGFEWKYDLSSAFSDWFHESKFDLLK